MIETGEFEDFVGHQFSNAPVLKERELFFLSPPLESGTAASCSKTRAIDLDKGVPATF